MNTACESLPHINLLYSLLQDTKLSREFYHLLIGFFIILFRKSLLSCDDTPGAGGYLYLLGMELRGSNVTHGYLMT